MIERIGPTTPSPSDKERKKIPDSGRFQEEMKIEKTGEAEFEKQKKRFYKPLEEEEPVEEQPTPYKTSFFERTQAAPPPQEESLPESPNFYRKIDLHESTIVPEKRQPTEETPFSLRKKEEKQKEKKGVSAEKKEEKIPYETLSLKKEKKELGEKRSPLLSKEEAEEILEEMPGEEKKEWGKTPFLPKKKEARETPSEQRIKEEKAPFFQQTATKAKKEPFTPTHPLTPEQEKELQKTKKREGEKEKQIEGKKGMLTQPKEAAATPQELPASVQTEASASVAGIAPYIREENLPLFERMVGTIILMTKQGLEKSEILLTSPTFVGSKYYGTRIIFEKYSTAPDSFNIHLTGSDEAVTTFNENLEGLMRAFDLGNFSFRVGRLWAEYETERPLFRRKSSVGEEGKGKEKEK